MFLDQVGDVYHCSYSRRKSVDQGQSRLHDLRFTLLLPLLVFYWQHRNIPGVPSGHCRSVMFTVVSALSVVVSGVNGWFRRMVPQHKALGKSSNFGNSMSFWSSVSAYPPWNSIDQNWYSCKEEAMESCLTILSLMQEFKFASFVKASILEQLSGHVRCPRRICE